MVYIKKRNLLQEAMSSLNLKTINMRYILR